MSLMNKNIILADDDEDDRDMFQDAVEEISKDVSLKKAVNGKNLMDILEESVPPAPDVIFLDLNMPIKNGFECLAEIREKQKFKQIPIVIFSTSCEKEFIDKVYDQGADYYICKPQNYNTLKNLISLVLSMNLGNNVAQPPRENFLLN